MVEWNVRETADGTEVSFFAKNSPPGSHFHVFKTYVFPDILRGHAYNLEKLTNPAAVLRDILKQVEERAKTEGIEVGKRIAREELAAALKPIAQVFADVQRHAVKA